MLGDYDDNFVNSDGVRSHLLDPSLCWHDSLSQPLEEVLELSRHDYHTNQVGPSRSSEPAWTQKQTLDRNLSSIAIEINDIDKQINDLKELRGALVRKKADVEKQLGDVQQTRARAGPVNKKGKGKATQGGIDYMKEMDWNDALKARMKNVFGIDNFRLCQQGCVCFISCTPVQVDGLLVF